MPVCGLTFDASPSHFVCLCEFVRAALTSVDEIWYFHPVDGMTRTLESISQVFWESCYWGHQMWYTSLRQLHPLFKVRMERRQHTVAVFQSGNIWQSSLRSLLFSSYALVHKHINIQWKLLRNPHRRKHQCTHSLCQSVSEVKLFHLSGVLLSSYKASVRTAGRLIVTY